MRPVRRRDVAVRGRASSRNPHSEAMQALLNPAASPSTEAAHTFKRSDLQACGAKVTVCTEV